MVAAILNLVNNLATVLRRYNSKNYKKRRLDTIDFSF